MITVRAVLRLRNIFILLAVSILATGGLATEVLAQSDGFRGGVLLSQGNLIAVMGLQVSVPFSLVALPIKTDLRVQTLLGVDGSSTISATGVLNLDIHLLGFKALLLGAGVAASFPGPVLKPIVLAGLEWPFDFGLSILLESGALFSVAGGSPAILVLLGIDLGF